MPKPIVKRMPPRSGWAEFWYGFSLGVLVGAILLSALVGLVV